MLFTADNHFNHFKIMLYCNRPFQYVEQMNAVMVDRWNDTVSPDDEVYHLGDLAFGSSEMVRDVIKRLNGNIVLITGNHDYKRLRAIRQAGVRVWPDRNMVLTIEGKKFFLQHRPQPDRMEWSGADYHLCGHVHEAWRTREAWQKSGGGTVLNVGVDVWYFRPIRLEEVFEELKI